MPRGLPRPMPVIMYPIWLTVLNASSRFKSVCTSAYRTPTSIVTVPTQSMMTLQDSGQGVKLCIRAAR